MTLLPLEPGPEPEPGRAALVVHWLHLTRTVLPGMAAQHRWPIRLDHCFMRVCLDHATAGRWDRTIRRPAIRHIPLPDLARAIAVAESMVTNPTKLPALNTQSLTWRKAPQPTPTPQPT